MIATPEDHLERFTYKRSMTVHTALRDHLVCQPGGTIAINSACGMAYWLVTDTHGHSALWSSPMANEDLIDFTTMKRITSLGDLRRFALTIAEVDELSDGVMAWLKNPSCRLLTTHEQIATRHGYPTEPTYGPLLVAIKASR